MSPGHRPSRRSPLGRVSRAGMPVQILAGMPVEALPGTPVEPLAGTPVGRPVPGALHRQGEKAEQVSRVHGPRGIHRPQPLFCIIHVFAALCQELLKGEPQAPQNALPEKGLDPVRVEQRRDVFRPQIMVDCSIQAQGRAQNRRGTQTPQPSPPAAPQNPEPARQQQEQNQIRTHQSHGTGHGE